MLFSTLAIAALASFAAAIPTQNPKRQCYDLQGHLQISNITTGATIGYLANEVNASGQLTAVTPNLSDAVQIAAPCEGTGPSWLYAFYPTSPNYITAGTTGVLTTTNNAALGLVSGSQSNIWSTGTQSNGKFPLTLHYTNPDGSKPATYVVISQTSSTPTLSITADVLVYQSEVSLALV